MGRPKIILVESVVVVVMCHEQLGFADTTFWAVVVNQCSQCMTIDWVATEALTAGFSSVPGDGVRGRKHSKHMSNNVDSMLEFVKISTLGVCERFNNFTITWNMKNGEICPASSFLNFFPIVN